MASALAQRILGPGHKLAPLVGLRRGPEVEAMPIGLDPFDTFQGGCPRGRITEITGGASSGRTSLLHRILHAASVRGEYTALIDGANAFDPMTASLAGVRLDMLVWVRCGGDTANALRAADLLVHAGGFGVVALDLCDAGAAARRIPVSYWYRFRNAAEQTRAMFVLLNAEPMAKSCAGLGLEVCGEEAEFTGQPPARMLRQARFSLWGRRTGGGERSGFEAMAVE